ncbi:MAG: exo-alpha-sialidase [Saprospiraceae bacterium]
MRSLPLLCLFLPYCFLACQQVPEQPLFDLTSTAVIGQATEKGRSGAANVVFQSTDDGQSWQDISAGLPQDLKPSTFFAGDGELFLGGSNNIYRKRTASKTANWEKEKSLEQPVLTLMAGIGGIEMPTEQSFNKVSAGNGGVIAFSTNGRFVQKLNGATVWKPLFTDFEGKTVRNVFTAKNGSVFIGSDYGLFKSDDEGKTWKHVMQNDWVIDIVESNGLLLCTSQKGILRSTDGGEHWDVVLNEGGVGIAVAAINGGFAAITYNTKSQTRRIRTSTDGGKTWQPIDAGLPPSQLISSIQQVGDYFYCGHPKGVYRSADQGKTWNLLLPTIGEKVFNLSVSDGVLYAVLQEGGC